MGLAPLLRFLARHRRIAIDTSIFIYQLEANPSYADLCAEVFDWLVRPSSHGITSTLTMTELLVRPYRTANEALVNRYYGLLSSYPNLHWIAPDLDIADTAARIRAAFRLRTPDALQVATAIRSGATALLTNDADLARVPEIEVGVLDRLRLNSDQS